MERRAKLTKLIRSTWVGATTKDPWHQIDLGERLASSFEIKIGNQPYNKLGRALPGIACVSSVLGRAVAGTTHDAPPSHPAQKGGFHS
jgi:hypothetical protein